MSVGTGNHLRLPFTLLVYGGLRLFQSRHVFGPMDLRVRRNRFGYVAFLLGYQVLCSTASLAGTPSTWQGRIGWEVTQAFREAAVAPRVPRQRA